jgi:hypothetical protein
MMRTLEGQTEEGEAHALDTKKAELPKDADRVEVLGIKGWQDSLRNCALKIQDSIQASFISISVSAQITCHCNSV